MSLQRDSLGPLFTNRFGDQYFFGINGHAFETLGAAATYETHYGSSLYKDNTLYVVIGTDSGLLPRHVAKEGIPEGSRYIFLELNVVKEKLEAEGIFSNIPKNMSICTESQFWKQAEIYNITQYFYHESVQVIGSLGTLDGNVSEYRDLFYRVQKNVRSKSFDLAVGLGSRAFIERQIENITENRCPASFLKGMFKGKTAVILGGGPSLDEFLPWVLKNKDKIAIFAVSRISRRLLEFGIKPHFVFSVDPQVHSFEISREMLLFPEDTVFIHAYHVVPQLPALWKGRSIYLGSRFPWKTSLEEENLTPWMPTVTNTALGVAVEMGFSQAVLVGVDLCFSQNGKTHAAASNNTVAGPKLFESITVETNGGDIAETSPDFFSSINFLEKQASYARNQGCRIISPAKNAAKVQNVDYLPISKIVLNPLEDAPNLKVLSQMPPDDETTRIADFGQILEELNLKKGQLRKILALSSEALVCNDRLFGRSGSKATNDYHYKRRMDKVENRLNRDFASLIPLVKQYGIRSFLKITRVDSSREWSDAEMENAGRVYYTAYKESAESLLQLVEAAIRRVECRLEEDSPFPNFSKIFDQWETDKTAGRVLVLKIRRPGIERFIQSSDAELFEKMESEFLKWVRLKLDGAEDVKKKYHSLAGVLGKALTFFRQRDTPGLERLLLGLHQRPNRGLAAELLLLVNGYIYELRKEQNKALAEYHALIGDEFTSVTEEALRRIAVISLEQKNSENALLALECLSSAFFSYKPKYADLLGLLGRRQEAADFYIEYLEKVPSDLAVLLKLGLNYKKMGFEDTAHKVFRMVLERDPQNAAAKTLLQEN